MAGSRKYTTSEANAALATLPAGMEQYAVSRAFLMFQGSDRLSWGEAILVVVDDLMRELDSEVSR